MAIYGKRWLSAFFLPVVELGAKGFIYKRKRYAWADVERVEVWQEPRALVAGPRSGNEVYVARALIWLRDGKAISIRDSAFEKKGEALMAGYSSAFDELITLLKANMKRETAASRVGSARHAN